MLRVRFIVFLVVERGARKHKKRSGNFLRVVLSFLVDFFC